MSKIRSYEVNGKEIGIESGSGNVFADLGLSNPTERAFKADLVRCITHAMQARELTQSGLGALVGLTQPQVSQLLRGRLSGFSIDKLFDILNRMDHGVEVRVSPVPRGKAKTVLAPTQPARRPRAVVAARSKRSIPSTAKAAAAPKPSKPAASRKQLQHV